jgi:hypothetical protein
VFVLWPNAYVLAVAMLPAALVIPVTDSVCRRNDDPGADVQHADSSAHQARHASRTSRLDLRWVVGDRQVA